MWNPSATPKRWMTPKPSAPVSAWPMAWASPSWTALATGKAKTMATLANPNQNPNQN